MKASRNGWTSISMRAAGVGLLACASATPLSAQRMGPDFAGSYSFADLGVPPGLPGSLGGVNFKLGDPNTMLLGGDGATPSGAIYEIPVTRDANGHIIAYAGSATQMATAPNIDGGLAYGPNNVLFFTQHPLNSVGQIKPGSTAPDKLIDLNALGVASSVGALSFVPTGFPGAGQLKFAPYETSTWYDAQVVPDGSGTFDIQNVTQTASISGGPEGMIYMPAGKPGFTQDHVLVAEWNGGRIGAYEIDANGDPVPATRRVFMWTNAAQGAVVDPLTNDLILAFSTPGGNILVVKDFVPPPSFFCTAKTTLFCGPASIALSGTSSASMSSGFTVSASPTRGCRSGILLYNRLQPKAGVPFGGPGNGSLCLVGSGLRRAGPIDSGGTSPATCDGVLAIDMNAFAYSNWLPTGCNPGAGQSSPAPFLFNIGGSVSAQFWFRDSLASGQGLSDGALWTIGP